MSAAPLLQILKDGEQLSQIEVDQDVLLGRADECVIRLNDRAVSRHHALIRATQDGGVSISKKSEFGEIRVNGADVQDAIVKVGDVILIGPYLLRLQARKEVEKPVYQSLTSNYQSVQTASLQTAEQPAQNLVLPPPPPEMPLITGIEEEAVLNMGQSSQLESPQSPLQAGDATKVLDDPLGLDSPVESAPSTDSMNRPDANAVDLNGIGDAPQIEDQTDLSESHSDDETKLLGSSSLRVSLQIPEGGANVTEFLIEKNEVVFGRSRKEGCDIILTDKKASKRHAVIRRRGPHYLIKNLSDTNGTFVNGRKIDEIELSGEDVIKIGELEIVFKAEDPKYAQREADFLQVPVEEPPVVQAPVEMLTAAQLTGANDPGLQALPGFQMPPPSFDSPPPFVLKKKVDKSLLGKFSALPPRKRILYLAVVAGLVWMFLEEEPPKPKAPVAKPVQVAAKTLQPKGVITFDDLSPEQKKFVETQHILAFDHYKNRDYDKSLYEVRKIFALINDYKDSREIERYALEGQQKLKALDDEKQKKEEEERLKQKIAAMLAQAEILMKAKKFKDAQSLFAEIRMLDPENPKVSAWLKEIEAYEEMLRQKESAKQTELENNKRTWQRYNEGMLLMKQAKYYDAIDVFKTIPDFKASDTRVEASAKSQIGAAYGALKAGRDPLLSEAKQLEDSGELAKAFQTYRKVSRADPRHPDAYKGMDRIRGVLHNRAKVLYTEAVLAESYSDLTLAKKRFQDVLEVAPEDDVYFGRATRKLKIYIGQKAEAEAEGGG